MVVGSERVMGRLRDLERTPKRLPRTAGLGGFKALRGRGGQDSFLVTVRHLLALSRSAVNGAFRRLHDICDTMARLPEATRASQTETYLAAVLDSPEPSPHT